MRNLALMIVVLFLFPASALAGRFEVNGGLSYSSSNYGNSDYSWTRRWTGSFGYHFSDRSEIEVSFQDVVHRTNISGYEDTTFHDQVYSLNWIQSLLGRGYIVDPYFKVGLGQLNRHASGRYDYMGGLPPASELASVIAIMGAGLRIDLTQRLGVRLQADSYLTRGAISTWKDNTSLSAGVSLYF